MKYYRVITYNPNSIFSWSECCVKSLDEIEENIDNSLIVFVSKKPHTKKQIEKFYKYENNLIDECYNQNRQMICLYCEKEIDLDIEEHCDGPYQYYCWSDDNKLTAFCSDKCCDKWNKDDDKMIWNERTEDYYTLSTEDQMVFGEFGDPFDIENPFNWENGEMIGFR